MKKNQRLFWVASADSNKYIKSLAGYFCDAKGSYICSMKQLETNSSPGPEPPGIFQLIEQLETAVDKVLERQVINCLKG
jgi:hypothetical protein